jgi:hypothetical protein
MSVPEDRQSLKYADQLCVAVHQVLMTIGYLL